MEYMKIRCPDCKNAAELSDDFTFVKCSECSFEMSYGSYVKYVAYRDARYRDILDDYKPRNWIWFLIQMCSDSLFNPTNRRVTHLAETSLGSESIASIIYDG